jgi:hypothetical protein
MLDTARVGVAAVAFMAAAAAVPEEAMAVATAVEAAAAQAALRTLSQTPQMSKSTEAARRSEMVRLQFHGR